MRLSTILITLALTPFIHSTPQEKCPFCGGTNFNSQIYYCSDCDAYY